MNGSVPLGLIRPELQRNPSGFVSLLLSSVRGETADGI
jgi:hypothetical protein